VLDEGNLYNPYAGMGNNPVGNVDPMGTWLYSKTKPGVAYAKGKLMGLGLKVDVVKTGYGYMLDIKSANSEEALARAKKKSSWWGGTSGILSAALNNNDSYFIDSSGDMEKQTQIKLAAMAEDALYGAEGGSLVLLNTLTFEKIKGLNAATQKKMERDAALLVEAGFAAVVAREAIIAAATGGAGKLAQGTGKVAQALRYMQKAGMAYQAGTGGYMIGHGATVVGEGLAEGDDEKVIAGSKEMLGGGVRVGGALLNAKQAQDADTARAAVNARNEALMRQNALPANQRNRIAATTGAAKPGILKGRGVSGSKITGVSGDECAEDIAVKALGGNAPGVKIAPAVVPRTMKIKPACDRCVGKFGEQLMKTDTDFIDYAR